MYQTAANKEFVTFSGLPAGNRLVLVITNAPSTPELQFKHSSDPNWYTVPEFVGTPDTQGLIMHEFTAPAPTVRLRFPTLHSGETTTYYVSLHAQTASIDI